MGTNRKMSFVLNAQTSFMFTKRVSELLQKAAGEDGGKAQKKAIIQSLLFLQSRVHSSLLVDDIHESSNALVRAGLDAMNKSSTSTTLPLQASALTDEIVKAMADEMNESRERALQQELASLSNLCSISSEHQLKALAIAINELRAKEADVMIHRDLAREVQSIVEETEYEDTNFALGSTPISSIITVLSHPAVQQHLRKDRAMVWGSSMGWIPFYLILAGGFQEVVGIELLATLHQVAVDVKSQIDSLATEYLQGLHIFQNDLLHSDLKGIDLLLLTDWCWDKELVEAATRKIATELSRNTILISYRGLEDPCLELIAEVAARVSWNPSSKFRVYALK